VIPAFTIILPHLHNPGNDAALKLCLSMLIDNTVSPFTLSLYSTGNGELYPTLNRMVDEAQTECCVIWSSDIFAAPAWDLPMLHVFNAETWVNGVVVEPGVMGVHPANWHEDFGRTPETFNRAAFQAWCTSGGAMPPGDGWVVPLMVSRSGWLALGGLDESMDEKDSDGFVAQPADQDLMDRWVARGHRLQRVRSFAYHLQRFSVERIQQHESRR